MNIKTLNIKKLEPHPLGAIFPPMGDEEYNSLVKGMKQNGFDPKHPIVIHEGKILDGNHRYSAAMKLKLTPPLKEFSGDDAFAFVVQENLSRRNLTPSQAAAIAAELVERQRTQEREAREREKQQQKASGAKPKKGAGKGKGKGKKRGGDKTAQAAKALSVSPRQVAKAVALKKADPAAFEQVKTGAASLNSATKQSSKADDAKARKEQAFSAAKSIIDNAIGEGAADILEKKLSARDIIKLSGIDKEEMIRIKPLLEAGWSLKLAINYKASALTPAFPMRNFLERAASQGGSFTWFGESYGTTYDVTITARAS